MKLVSKGAKNVTTSKVRALFASLQLGKYAQYRFGPNDKKYGFQFVKMRQQTEDNDSDSDDE